MYDQLLKNLKILPLLIVVASLAFAVRLGEIVIDPNASLGQANAEVEKEEMVPETDNLSSVEEETIQLPATQNVDWGDAEEHDIEFSSVRAELFETLATRRKDLDTREGIIEQREALLKAAEQELDRKYQELDKIRGEIHALLVQQSTEEKERIERLVKIYEGMKAKDAAKIFNTLDMDILIDVTSHMSERKLAPVMAAMDPDRARSVTIFLAEQKSLPTLPDQ